MPIYIRITSKTKAARDKAYGNAFSKRYELDLWGWKKSQKSFVTVFQGNKLPTGFKQKIRASTDDTVEIKMHGETRYVEI